MNDSREDNCKDMKELLSAYRDRELDAGDYRRVDQHLGNCSDCRAELAAVESAVLSLKSLPTVTLSRDFADDIESIIKRSQAEPAAEPRGKVLPFERKTGKAVWIAAAAAASIFLMVAAYMGTTGGGAPTVATKNADSPAIAVKPAVDATEQVAQTTPAKKTDVVAADIEQPKPALNSKENEVSKEATVKVAALPKEERVQPRSKEVQPAHQLRRAQNADLYVDDLADNEALVAFSDTYDENDIFDTGISTDEDGLYAIKM